MSLLSDLELAAIRGVALTGMQTPVYISDHSVVETVDGSGEIWTERASPVIGWLHSSPTEMIHIFSGAQGIGTTYRLYLPVGTDITTGDRARIDSQVYTVVDTDAESTWLPMLTVTLRKGE